MKRVHFRWRNVAAIAVCLAATTVFSGCGPEDDPDNGTNTPGAVIDFTATAGDGQVSLTWTVPYDNGGSEITGYEVTMDAWASKVTKAASELSHTYTGLTNGTEYTFKVRAANANGAGAESTAKATPQTLSSGPLGAWSLPANLKVTYKANNVVGTSFEDALLSMFIKIGDNYYGQSDGHHQWSELWRFYLRKNNPATPGTWTYFPRSRMDGAWETPAHGENVVRETGINNILGYLHNGRATVENRPVVGTDVVLGRPVEIRTSPVGSRYYIDIQYNVVLKIFNVNQSQTIFEIKSWDETVTDFSGIGLP